MTCAYEEKEGMLVNSGEFTGMEMHKAMSAIMDKAEAEASVNAVYTIVCAIG